MPTIKYIGAADNYSETPVTGKQSVWQVGQQEYRETSEANLLLATGLFAVQPVPVYAIVSSMSSGSAELNMVVSDSAPDDGDGRPDGTIYIQVY